jgi:hypothetical protein
VAGVPSEWERRSQVMAQYLLAAASESARAKNHPNLWAETGQKTRFQGILFEVALPSH